MNTATLPKTLQPTTDSQQTATMTGQASASPIISCATQDDNGFSLVMDQLRQQLVTCRTLALAQQLQAAKHLHELRPELFPGEWSRLFTDGSLPIKNLRTAQLMTRVAGNVTLMSPKNLSRLPAALSSLSWLARVKPDVLQTALDSGRITPDSTAREVAVFVRAACGLPPAQPKAPAIPRLL